MFLILDAQWLAPGIRRLIVQAPHVLRHHQPGHFVIVRVAPESERIPLTVADTDHDKQTITLIVQVVGATTEQLCNLETGQSVLDVAGPLGKPTEIKKFGHVVLVGGGVGTAVILPQAKALKNLGNRVSAVIGGRSKDYVILEQDLSQHCDAVYPCTDDGSYGYHGFVTGQLNELIADKAQPVDAVIAAGPVPMMKAVAEVTRPHGIHTIVSLNPIMVDGTGMCGGCRVMVGDKMLFACVDGPEFDAHQVDFDELRDRLTAYRTQEKRAWDHKPSGHVCKCKVAEVPS
ncbi:MAG: sulfide/dihydroorotate dehydrogenase-like FAD/NAD-binding protein [Phycisphaerales bacterium]|nr:sulfide/dihydroorotate dehydrogenase-like FAD/NAD-binding protein [Phycisphaerales bacterium]